MKYFEKIKENRDFRRIYNRGKSAVAKEFVLYACSGKPGKVRLGITATKKIGCAVNRNRAKRVITAAFRECAADISQGDFVIVARSGILRVKSTRVAQIMKKQLTEFGFLK